MNTFNFYKPKYALILSAPSIRLFFCNDSFQYTERIVRNLFIIIIYKFMSTAVTQNISAYRISIYL